MDNGTQPLAERLNVTAAEHCVQIANVTGSLFEKLRGVEISERIRREVTERPRAPVHVLQYAVGIGQRLNAQVLSILGVPGLRQIGHLQLVVDERKLQFEADQNVQIVG